MDFCCYCFPLPNSDEILIDYCPVDIWAYGQHFPGPQPHFWLCPFETGCRTRAMSCGTLNLPSSIRPKKLREGLFHLIRCFDRLDCTSRFPGSHERWVLRTLETAYSLSVISLCIETSTEDRRIWVSFSLFILFIVYFKSSKNVQISAIQDTCRPERSAVFSTFVWSSC